MDRLDRFNAKIEIDFETGCLLWTGAKTRNGYANFWSGERYCVGHRWLYEYAVGPIPKGLELDHLCRVRHRVNPDHVEPVTPRENRVRGISPVAKCAARDHCGAGHPYTPENTRIDRRGKRRCRECNRRWAREASRRYQRRIRAQVE